MVLVAISLQELGWIFGYSAWQNWQCSIRFVFFLSDFQYSPHIFNSCEVRNHFKLNVSIVLHIGQPNKCCQTNSFSADLIVIIYAKFTVLL